MIAKRQLETDYCFYYVLSSPSLIGNSSIGMVGLRMDRERKELGQEC